MIRVITLEELNAPAEASTSGFGSLETARGALPLARLDVDVQVEGLAAHTTLRQQFVNVFAEPLEATYIFPLPPRAAVIGFRMAVNDHVIEGRIDERAKARADYAEAIRQGRSAAIAEEERPDVFTLRVGNIPPKAAARVEFTMVAPLAVDSLEATYRFPLVVAQRYCPGVALPGESVGDGVADDTDLVPDASRISPPVLLPGFKSPVRLGIRVRIARSSLANSDQSGDSALGCTLPADEARDAAGDRIVAVVPGQRLDRDFVLRWKIGQESVAVTSLFVEPDVNREAGLGRGGYAREAAGDGTFALVVVPPTGRIALRTPSDVVFVLDRSGSMEGWKIAAARRAVARMIDTFTAEDRVAVLAFDDQCEHPDRTFALSSATDRRRWQLLEWLGRIDSRGGTEMAEALQQALGVFEHAQARAANETARERVVVLVTDGQVGDEDRVLATLVASGVSPRVFIVGIDTALNEGLLGRLADASGGTVEMVESEDRLDAVMERIRQRVVATLVQDIAIEGRGVEIVADSLVPGKLPDLVAGVPLVVRGRYRGTPSGEIRVCGRDTSGAAWEATAPATVSAAGGLGNLWARGRLRHLEDLRTAGNSPLDSNELEWRIVELSLAFGVLCRFTALVAIDPRQPDRKLEGVEPRRIVQPVEEARMIASLCCAAEPRQSGLFSEMSADSLLLASYAESTERSVFRRVKQFWRARATDRDQSPPAGDWAAADPQGRLRAKAASLVRKVKPRSGLPADVSERDIRWLLREVARLLAKLQANNAAETLLQPLSAAYARLNGLCGDTMALTSLLEALADAAETAAPVDRWWRPAPDRVV